MPTNLSLILLGVSMISLVFTIMMMSKRLRILKLHAEGAHDALSAVMIILLASGVVKKAEESDPLVRDKIKNLTEELKKKAKNV